MKKINLLATIFLLPATLLAQPTIHHMDDYTIGSKIITLTCDPMAPGNPGANMTWDFSALVSLGTNADTVVTNVIAPPTNAPIAGATFVMNTADGSNDYFLKTATGNFALGNYDSSNNLTAKYNHPLQSAIRPVTYGATLSDTLTGTASLIVPLATIKAKVNAVADGYGTLKLPNGTYNNVLRIKIVMYDTIAISLPTPSTTTSKNITWYWYDDNHNAPLLEIDSSYAITSAGNDTSASTDYLLKEKTTGIGHVAANKIPFNASFTDNGIMLNGTFTNGSTYQLAVFNMAGQKVLETTTVATNNKMHGTASNALSPGVYIVTLMNENDAATLTTLKVVKQ